MRATIPHDAVRHSGIVPRIAVALLAVAIIVPVGWRFAHVAYQQLVFPFDLCFETPNLATVKVIRDGGNPYSASVYDAMPFVLTMYTPLYHYVVAMLPADSKNPFLPGRLVSMICVLGCGLVPYVVHRRGRRQRWIACVLPFLLFSSWSLMSATAFFKNDPLAMLLSAGGVATLSATSSRRSFIAGALCILAVASKQSFVAAAAACLCFLILRDRREAVRFLTVVIGLVISGAIAATWGWGSGFWFSVVGAVRQPFDIDTGLRVIRQVVGQPLFVAVLLGSLATLIRECVGRGLRVTLCDSPFAFYLFFSWSVALLTIWKVGASANYLFEPHLASVLWLSHWLRADVEWRPDFRLLPFLLCIAVLSGFEMVASRPGHYTFATASRSDVMRQRSTIIQQASSEAGVKSPKFLNLVTHIDALLLSEHVYLNDPYLYRLLWEQEILSPAPVARAVLRGKFDLVAIPPAYIGAGPFKPHERLLRESLRYRYRILKRVPALGYVLLIRCDYGVGIVLPVDGGSDSSGHDVGDDATGTPRRQSTGATWATLTPLTFPKNVGCCSAESYSVS